VLQDMQPLPVGIQSTPPRAHTHTRAPTQLPSTALTCLSCPATVNRPAHVRPHEPRASEFSSSSHFSFLRSRPFRRVRRGTQDREGSTPSAGSGVPGLLNLIFPRQIGEGCHPTEACTRPTVSSCPCRYVLYWSLTRS
jgi:hypothetical protein